MIVITKKAALFFTSNCGGCHGNDGKGMNGAFPDLTLNPLLGIMKNKEYLQRSLNTLKKSLSYKK
jgi:mono/diheme cytochrome c family protein